MSVRLTDQGVIAIEGICPIDDAEPLQRLLLENPAAIVDWRGCEHAHSALIQLLFVANPTILGPVGSVFLRNWIERALVERKA